MATRKIERLEKILQAYEDHYWAIKITAGEMGNVLPSAFFLRRALQKNERVDGLCSLLWKLSIQQSLDGINFWKNAYDVATDLADWVFGSRRAFRVSPSLANMLLETDLPDFLPTQVKFVAPAFVVVLDEPIKCLAKFQTEHDFFVFASYQMEEGDRAISIRSYSPGYDTYQGLTPLERARIKKPLQTGGRISKKILSQLVERSRDTNYTGFDLFCPDDVPYNEILNDESEEAEARALLFRLCFGLNLYLQSARKGDSEKRHKVQSRSSDRGDSVVKRIELFELSVSEAFQRPAGSSNEATGREISPHFRRGFWRRRKGFGDDPEALKTEWVRPTWVRKDRIARGEQPIGSFQDTKCK